MSRLMTGILGALALSLISGAATFALGRDLPSLAGNQAPITQALASGSPPSGASLVNRGSKTDRAAVPASPSSTRTVSLKFDAFADTTFLVRVPVTVAGPPASPAPVKPAMRKPMVACDPVVSVLTEVAKRLEPGRCVA
jgi:hypothetical protein